MGSAFSNLNGFEMFFLACAGVGTVFVLFRLVMQFVGANLDLEGDVDVDVQHLDSDVFFKILSVHGLTSFLMMFGFVGFALYRQTGVGLALSTIGATVAGVASVWLIGRLFRMFGRLQSSGTLATHEAVGSSGTVYLTIPAGGTGRVTINFNGRLREFDAAASDGAVLPTGTPVKVVRVTANVLVVQTIS